MTTTVTETKKTTIALIREYKNKFITAWPCILLFFFVYLHVLLLKIFPSLTAVATVWTASLYQIIGAGCVLYQINGSLKILKGADLGQTIKQYFATWPKRTARAINIQCKTGSISATGSVSGVLITKTQKETVEEKIERLSKKIDELDEKIDENKRDVSERINKNQQKNDKKFNALNVDIKTLNENLENTVIGDYKIAIFGVFMITYGIVIPIIGLYA